MFQKISRLLKDFFWLILMAQRWRTSLNYLALWGKILLTVSGIKVSAKTGNLIFHPYIKGLLSHNGMCLPLLYQSKAILMKCLGYWCCRRTLKNFLPGQGRSEEHTSELQSR